jgi:hypothetical protein
MGYPSFQFPKAQGKGKGKAEDIWRLDYTTQTN